MIILCGMPGCGKTSVGRVLSEKMRCPFIDVDRLIESETGKSCRELLLQVGEKAFRAQEKTIIMNLAQHPKSVIALGGGALMDAEVITHLKNLGVLLYLKVSTETLVQRMLKKKEVPAYLHKEDAIKSYCDLEKSRTPIFEAHCQHYLDVTQLTLNQIAEEIYLSVADLKAFTQLKCTLSN